MTCECGNISERNGKCATCNRLERKAEKQASQPLKKQKPIAKVSNKMAKALKEYAKLRKQFLEANPKCAVYPTEPSIEVHHMAGRNTIELLLDTDKWLAVSREGHVEIETHPAWAKKCGFSLSRLSTETI